jgi:hypothetical protein
MSNNESDKPWFTYMPLIVDSAIHGDREQVMACSIQRSYRKSVFRQFSDDLSRYGCFVSMVI